jgi:hypothetical protein
MVNTCSKPLHFPPLQIGGTCVTRAGDYLAAFFVRADAERNQAGVEMVDQPSSSSSGRSRTPVQPLHKESSDDEWQTSTTFSHAFRHNISEAHSAKQLDVTYRHARSHRSARAQLNAKQN